MEPTVNETSETPKEELKDKEEQLQPAEQQKEAEPAKISGPKKEKKKTLLYSIIIVLLIAIVALGVLDYPKISGYIKSKTNPYNFDFNYNKIKRFDWDTILTRKNIASVLGTARKNINSAKNPDWAWILDDPAQLVNEANCASLLDEKILDQENENKKNLWNASIMLCKNVDETKKTFTGRKDEIKGVSEQDKTVTIKSLNDINTVGEEGYTYLIEKAAEKEGSAPQQFAGIVYRRGPFMVMVDESEQEGVSYLSTDEMRMKIAQYLDKELKGLLTWY